MSLEYILKCHICRREVARDSAGQQKCVFTFLEGDCPGQMYAHDSREKGSKKRKLRT